MTMDSPLPGMPELPPVMRKAPKPGLRFTRVRGNRLCERCCRDIHERGVGVAPLPRVARWQVTSDGGAVERLCEGHKGETCQ